MNMICKSLLSQNLHFRVENTASKRKETNKWKITSGSDKFNQHNSQSNTVVTYGVI